MSTNILTNTQFSDDHRPVGSNRYQEVARYAVLFVMTLSLIVPLAGCGGSSNSSEKGPALQLSRQTMEGDTLKLADYEGSVLIVNFWATWCAPCRAEIPEFVELQEEYGDDGLQFVGVSLDREGFEVVRPFAREHNINYPLVVDNGKLAKAEPFGGIQGLPTTFILDREGNIEKRIDGLTSRRQLEPIITSLLGIDTPSGDEPVSDTRDTPNQDQIQPEKAHSSPSSSS